MKRLFSLFFALLLLSFGLAATVSAQSIRPGTEIRVQLLSQLDTGKTQVARNSRPLSRQTSLWKAGWSGPKVQRSRAGSLRL